jgi:hypothetical protein
VVKFKQYKQVGEAKVSIGMAQRCCHFYLSISRALHARAILKPPSISKTSLSQAFYQTFSIPSHSNTPYPPPPPFDINFDFDHPTLFKFIQFLKNNNNDDDAHFLSSLEEPNTDLICSAIWVLREDWKPALRAFKLNSLYNNEKACNLMIWVLGTHAKFSTAWSIIRDMHNSSISTHQAMLIIIDRYITFFNHSYQSIQT